MTKVKNNYIILFDTLLTIKPRFKAVKKIWVRKDFLTRKI